MNLDNNLFEWIIINRSLKFFEWDSKHNNIILHMLKDHLQHRFASLLRFFLALLDSLGSSRICTPPSLSLSISLSLYLFKFPFFSFFPSTPCDLIYMFHLSFTYHFHFISFYRSRSSHNLCILITILIPPFLPFYILILTLPLSQR